MQNAFRKYTAPPSFPDDEDKTRSAAIVNIIGWSTIAILMVLLVIRTFQGRDVNLVEVNLSLIATVITIAFVLYLSRQGDVKVASLLLVAIIWLGLSYLTWVADGIRDVAFFGYFIPILMAGLLLGWQGAIAFIAFSVFSGWALAYAEASQMFIPTLDQPLNFARDMTGIFVLTGILLYLMINNLQHALDRSRSTSRQLSVSNSELDALRVDLEQRVEARTSELKKRATQLEAVSSVARTIASVQDINTLLPDITKLVSQQFGFYHVGIFLTNPTHEFALLRAANSEGGQRMLNQEFRLPIQPNSIVGYTLATGEARIALDVGSDSIYFDNPDLPETHSEMALPLRTAGQIIGALDVQSTELNAFSQEDIAVLATLADQITLAIENARLFGEARNALSESKTTFEKYIKQEWHNFANQSRHAGFLFDGKQAIPLDSELRRGQTKAVSETGSLSLDKASVAVPIKLRGQTIGVLDVRSKKGKREWTQDEISLLEAAAERAALALENARLVESAQRRASRERAISEITTRIGAVTHVESILQTAVEELGRKIGGGAEVILELDTEER
ncbi:MAG TPA: GAF domain-containing protein [Anaerolineales bacterium]|nr:GAF domain-containing protein [Anaerolineales bacterium]